MIECTFYRPLEDYVLSGFMQAARLNGLSTDACARYTRYALKVYYG